MNIEGKFIFMVRYCLIVFIIFLFEGLQAQAPSYLSELFVYKKSIPFSYQLKNSERYKNTNIKTININNDKLQKIEALLIEPRADGRFPVVIFQHGGESDNSYFLQEAKELSRKGMICLLIEAPWLRSVYKNKNLWANTAQFYRQGIIDIQRSIDFLTTLPNVDTARIAFTGHSYGAQMAGILAGIEPRLMAFVVMSGSSNLTELLKRTDHEQITHVRDSIPLDFGKWIEQMEPLNPVHFIKHTKSPVFFQFATNDEYDIDDLEAKKYVAITPRTEHVRFYVSGHQLKNKKAEEDRTNWLIQKLQPKEVPESSLK